MSRRKRRSNDAFSLFAFQDIITSVTGIVILITLLLAIELMDRTNNTRENQTSQRNQETLATLQDLRNQIAILKLQFDAAEDELPEIPTTDIDELRKIVDDETAKLTNVNLKIKNRSDDLADRSKELEDKQNRFEKMTKTWKETRKVLTNDIQEMSAKLKQLEDGSRLFFKPGSLEKTTWIVDVSGRGIQAAKIGVAQKPNEFPTLDGFLAWTGTLDKGEVAFFFCVRPKGIFDFEKIRKSLNANFRIGFRPVGFGQKVVDEEFGVGL